MMTAWDRIVRPTLLLDEVAARRNIARIAGKARAAGVAFRPHFKTHQSATIGEWFRAEGISSITVSSADMAVYFADHGWQDILLAFPVNLRQAEMLSALAARVRLGLLVESPEAVTALAAACTKPVEIWLKIDTGAHRTGLPWDDPAAVSAVAQAVLSTSHFRLRGLLTHAGHTYRAENAEEVCRRSEESIQRIDALRSTLQSQQGIKLSVSVGDTPSASLCADFGAADEIRPGNFIFYDAQQMHLGACGWQDVAVTLACPVVARHPERGEVVIYGGAVHLSKDTTLVDGKPCYGYVCLPDGKRWGEPLEDTYVSALSQEHGVIHMPGPIANKLAIGNLVCILPAHSCLTVTLMRHYRTLDGQTIDTLNCD